MKPLNGKIGNRFDEVNKLAAARIQYNGSNKLSFHRLIMRKMTGEAPEVRSDKGKPIEKTREREREKREKERKGEKEMARVNYYQSAFNSQKEKLNILAEMLKISKSGRSIYNRPPSL